MRVTRSRSAGKPEDLGLQGLAKVGKPQRKTEQLRRFPATQESLVSSAVKSEGHPGLSDSAPVDQASLVQVPRLPSKTSAKPHIEQSFAHIQTPADPELPPNFVTYHTPEFVSAIKHILNIDSTLYPAIAHGNFAAFANKNEDSQLEGLELINSYWYSLISSVISQQVSGSAAKAIQTRFNDLFEGTPTPKATLDLQLDTLKAVGLLSMKLKYVVHISEVFSDPESRLTSVEFYKHTSTEELIAELTKLKGIGEWSANMFAVFTLKELDIFAYDDLGVARGVARYLQVRPKTLEETKNGVHAIEELKARLKRKSKFHSAKSKRDWTPLHDEYVKFLALKFEPYRTAFMLVMWRLSSTNIDVLEKDDELRDTGSTASRVS
ncbi:DNA glycosylase [Metschnikowia bicuspidata var. bicuspidata NRRL YB-4993]|uniref:DNA glycosylase n=1 Tax=Metschnikowia bicuspidata var. bicuspidata NRRL YB-4993 TaxID=869754 RepID=A0A1A0HAL5_9ASCO|nr:DNA glycosylase [Metschnikowia bicuspidata var. bicuspidata NRRL YB-4993]OBA20917.1 DNA glycosylase [Metschnikowia bicuspidata var. bicuspidata NRRL YB-4993]